MRRRSHPKTTSGTGMPVKNTTALAGSGTAANDVEAPNTSFAFGELLLPVIVMTSWVVNE